MAGIVPPHAAPHRAAPGPPHLGGLASIIFLYRRPVGGQAGDAVE